MKTSALNSAWCTTQLISKQTKNEFRGLQCAPQVNPVTFQGYWLSWQHIQEYQFSMQSWHRRHDFLVLLCGTRDSFQYLQIITCTIWISGPSHVPVSMITPLQLPSIKARSSSPLHICTSHMSEYQTDWQRMTFILARPLDGGGGLQRGHTFFTSSRLYLFHAFATTIINKGVIPM